MITALIVVAAYAALAAVSIYLLTAGHRSLRNGRGYRTWTDAHDQHQLRQVSDATLINLRRHALGALLDAGNVDSDELTRRIRHARELGCTPPAIADATAAGLTDSDRPR